MNLFYILNHDDEIQPTSPPNLIKYKPFWNDFTRNLTNQCWLPLKTTNRPLCPSHWDDSLKRLALGSWVTVNSTKSTSINDDSVPDGSSIWRSFKDDVISLERNEDMSSSSSSTSSKKPPAGKALKIRLYPNLEEKQKLLKWIGTARWTYNQSLAAINSDIKNKNKKYLRANYITRSVKFEDPNLKWVLDIPRYIRDAAMLDL